MAQGVNQQSVKLLVAFCLPSMTNIAFYEIKWSNSEATRIRFDPAALVESESVCLININLFL